MTLALSLVFLCNFLLSKLIKALRDFETDVDNYIEEASQFDIMVEDLRDVLPQREKKKLARPQ